MSNRRFVQTKRRRAQINNDLGALLDQPSHRFDVVKRAREIMFRPDIFGNLDAEFFPPQVKWFHPAGGFKISVFIKDIVSGQERFVRRAHRLTRFKQGGCIMKWLARAFISLKQRYEEGSGSHARMKAFENLKVLGNKA